MRKILLVLVLLSSIMFAQSDISNVQEALCQLQETTQALMAMSVAFFIILAVPIIGVGIFFYVKKKPRKKLGIVLMIVGVALPVIFALIYILMPLIISVLTGVETGAVC